MKLSVTQVEGRSLSMNVASMSYKIIVIKMTAIAYRWTLLSNQTESFVYSASAKCMRKPDEIEY